MRWLSLFAGCGGLDLGLVRAGHQVIAAAETYGPARAIHARWFPDVELYGDVADLRAKDLPAIDGIAAGFPCQPFSSAGDRKGFADTRGTLFGEVARLVRKTRPPYLLLENVRGLLAHDEGRTFGTILRAMDELGYNAAWQVLDGAMFLPQHRPHVFICGVARDRPWSEILPVGVGAAEPAAARGRARRTRLRVRHADHSAAGSDDSRTTVVDESHANSGRLTSCEGKGGGRQYVAHELIPSASSTYRVYSARAIARRLKTPSGGHTATGLYAIDLKERRSTAGPIHTDGIAPRILTSGGSANVGTITIDGKPHRVRRLTPLECERLQGFPEGWTSGHSNTARYRVLGNAVMVPLAEYVAARYPQAPEK